MENLDQVLKLWEKDSEIDQTEPGKELLKIPQLHKKYLTILIKHRIASKDASHEYNRMRKIKWEYYTGKFSQEQLEEYGWEQFKYTLKADLSYYMDSDLDLIKCLKTKAIHDEIIYASESILGELKSRTYQLKDFIAWERFIGGN